MPTRISKKVDVSRLLDELGSSKSTGLPHLSELAEAFIREAGGPEQMASLLLEEFKKAQPGSLVRAQLFGMIQKVWKYATDSLRVEDPESLGDDELDQEIRKITLELLRDAATDDATPDLADDRAAPAVADR